MDILSEGRADSSAGGNGIAAHGGGDAQVARAIGAGVKLATDGRQALGGRQHQAGFHRIRGQGRVGLQHERHRAHHDRGGHGRARQDKVRRDACPTRIIRADQHLVGAAVLSIQHAAGVSQRDNAVAGRDQVGLEDAVAEGRPAAGISRDAVIGTRAVHRFHGADGNHIGVIAGRLDRAVVGAVAFIGERRIIGVLLTPGVARRADHHDPGLVGGFHGLAQGVCLVALTDRVP